MNCLLNEDHSVMKLGDFGISVQLEEGETTTRGRLGTANYMAPEMLEGVFAPREDSGGGF